MKNLTLVGILFCLSIVTYIFFKKYNNKRLLFLSFALAVPAFLVVVSFLGLVSTAFAAMDPVPPYCEHQGYKLDWGTYLANGKGDVFCVFDDGNKCEIWDFYQNKCGLEYVRSFSCVEEGKPAFQFDTCCGNLVPHLPPGMVGQGTCQPPVKAFLENIYLNPTFWLIVVVGVVGFIIFFIRRKR